MTFAERLAERRAAAGISQARVARLVDVTVQTVGSWERGVTTPSIAHLRPLAAALDCEVTDLLPEHAEVA